MKNSVKLARNSNSPLPEKSVKSAKLNNTCLMTSRDDIWLVVAVVVAVATIVKRRHEAIIVELQSVPTNTGNCSLIWSTEKTKPKYGANIYEKFP